MIVNNSLDEVKKRESALKIIKEIIKDNGRDSLYDVTGLSGGFILARRGYPPEERKRDPPQRRRGV